MDGLSELRCPGGNHMIGQTQGRYLFKLCRSCSHERGERVYHKVYYDEQADSWKFADDDDAADQVVIVRDTPLIGDHSLGLL